MDIKKMLPIGIERFEEIASGKFYYVDKTGLLKELLHVSMQEPLRQHMLWLFRLLWRQLNRELWLGWSTRRMVIWKH